MQAAISNVVQIPDRPRLLVSVRGAEEALAAVAGGADIIDVKEPAHGPLGMASPTVIAAIAQTLRQQGAGRLPFSAALGELREFSSLAELNLPLEQLDWIKIGLSGLAGTDWPSRWRKLREDLCVQSPQTNLIAVVYVDWKTCQAPPPEDVISAALATDVPGILFDTYAKRGKTLLDHFSLHELTDALQRIHAAERFAALAGSIGRPHLKRLAELGPDILAVRSAACAGGREGRVATDLVAALKAEIEFSRAARAESSPRVS